MICASLIFNQGWDIRMSSLNQQNGAKATFKISCKYYKFKKSNQVSLALFTIYVSIFPFIPKTLFAYNW